MQLLDLTEIIEKTAPPVAAAAWDASGIQVASLRKDVSHIAVMLDPTLESLSRGVEAGADFFLAHHPLSMKPRFPDKADEYLKILSLLLSRQSCLYSAHTSLDANPEGPVSWLAAELGLAAPVLLETTAQGGEGQPYGFGFVGDLSDAVSYGEFCRRLADALGQDGWQVAGPEPETVHTVACCPGSGSGLFEEAIERGANVFITGDVKYHAALDAGIAGLRLIDVGHFVLEEEMMRRFALMLGKAVPVPVTFIPGRDPLHGETAGAV